MSWRRLFSRWGLPTAPRKYFVVTMLVALMLHSAGNSTPRCSKLIDPSRQLVMTTSRRSQVTSSYGCTPAVVKTRLTFRPLPRLGALPPRREREPARPSSVSVMVCVLSLVVIALIADRWCGQWIGRRLGKSRDVEVWVGQSAEGSRGVSIGW